MTVLDLIELSTLELNIGAIWLEIPHTLNDVNGLNIFQINSQQMSLAFGNSILT